MNQSEKDGMQSLKKRKNPIKKDNTHRIFYNSITY